MTEESPVIAAFRALRERIDTLEQHAVQNQRAVAALRAELEAARGETEKAQRAVLDLRSEIRQHSVEPEKPVPVGHGQSEKGNTEQALAQICERILQHVANAFEHNRIAVAYSVLSAVFHQRLRRLGIPVREILDKMVERRALWRIISFRGVAYYLPWHAQDVLDASAIQCIKLTGVRSEKQKQTLLEQQRQSEEAALYSVPESAESLDAEAIRKLGLTEERGTL